MFKVNILLITYILQNSSDEHLPVAELVDIPGNPTATRKKKHKECDKENMEVYDIVRLSKDATYHPTQRLNNEPRRERISRSVKSELLAKLTK